MIRLVLRFLGALLGVLALGEGYLVMQFRLEGSDELREIERLDFALGGLFALAFILLVAPSRCRRRCLSCCDVCFPPWGGVD